MLLFIFESYLLQQLFIVFLFHKNGGSESAVFGNQCTNAILRAGIFSFMYHGKIFYAVVAEKIS